MIAPKHILVFRFSSLGDIAMTVPVIRVLLLQHKQLTVTFVSVSFVKPLFQNIERLHFVTADLKGKHKGVKGLYRLYNELTATTSFDAVADLHNVLRTKILRVFFTGKRMAAIDKGRGAKKAMTRQHNKVLTLLKTTFQRYADVFSKLDVPVILNIEQGIEKRSPYEILSQQASSKWIGIAPFARYEEKTYPVNKIQQVIQLLLQEPNLKIVLLGGKEDEVSLQQLAEGNKSISVLAGNISLTDELDIIANLDVMISMDSANMHLASLFGVPVVSVWGGTHPYLGFLGWGQKLENCVQIDLDCRPSSVFGNKPCRNQLACMNGISPLMIVEKVMGVLIQKQ